MRIRMIKLQIVLGVVAMLCLPPPASAVGVGNNTRAFVAGEVMVKLNSGVDVRAFATANKLNDNPGGIEQLANHPIYRLQILDGSSPPDKAADLSKNQQVIYAEPDYYGEIPEARRRSSWTVGDNLGLTDYMEQWAVSTIGLPEAHMVTRGASVTIAVLDTGVDMDHPALRGHLLNGYDFVDSDADPSEAGVEGPDSAFGHGTHVAGLLALVAPDAKILPVRFLAPDGTGTNWRQAQALNYAASHGADIINLSYSSDGDSRLIDDILAKITCNSAFYDKCRSKDRPGAVIVAAAGNSGAQVREYPAASTVPGVLASAASTESDRLASFSTYGPWIQLEAPGDRILSCFPGGRYALWSGTSMAAPLAAGTAALVRAVYPTLKPTAVVTQMRSTAASVGGPVRWRLNAAGAIDPRDR
ncbi:MAG: S8 family serine peptidase [Roseiflexaceae bacterium]